MVRHADVVCLSLVCILCIPGRVAGRNDLSYIVNSGKTHCKCQCYKLN